MQARKLKLSSSVNGCDDVSCVHVDCVLEGDRIIPTVETIEIYQCYDTQNNTVTDSHAATIPIIVTHVQ